jgi:hypothetical protein
MFGFLEMANVLLGMPGRNLPGRNPENDTKFGNEIREILW